MPGGAANNSRRAWPGGSGGSAGVTLLEMLLVIALMAAVSVLAAPLVSGSVREGDLDAAAALAVDALGEAQTSAMSGKSPRIFGVHFETTKFVFFRGASYNPADPDNDIRDLGQQVSVSSVSISGGGSDIHFSDYRGIPAETGSVVFSGVDGGTRTVAVNAAGLIDLE
jgi:Tfp pilus assembly protein FimT